MASEQAPAFQFYAADFLKDEVQELMSPAEAGVYVRLLARQWLEGSIPEDFTEMARLCGAKGKREMARLWKRVGQKFVPLSSRPGRLVNLRLEEVRQIQQDFRDERSRAGRDGAAKRWDKRRHVTAIAQVMAQPSVSHCPGNASSSSSSSTPLPPKGEEGGDGRMEAFWEHWRDALKRFRRATANLTPTPNEAGHVYRLLIRYPDDQRLYAITDGYLSTEDKTIRHNGVSIGSLAHWAAEVEGALSAAGRL